MALLLLPPSAPRILFEETGTHRPWIVFEETGCGVVPWSGSWRVVGPLAPAGDTCSAVGLWGLC